MNEQDKRKRRLGWLLIVAGLTLSGASMVAGFKASGAKASAAPVERAVVKTTNNN